MRPPMSGKAQSASKSRPVRFTTKKGFRCERRWTSRCLYGQEIR
jgi:hypothetical protein